MNYPNGQKSTTVKNEISYSNRGMGLEDDINKSNQYYLDSGKAVVHKKPTPIQIVKVDYSTVKITEAYFKTPSTTDYNGVYDGLPLDFEAKETKSKTSFSFSLVHEHQFKHLEDVIRQKAVAFLIISFTRLDKVYYVKASDMLNEKKEGKKSLPVSWFADNAYLIERSLKCPIDYLRIVDKLKESKELL